MEVYIKGIGNISPQNTIQNKLLDKEIILHQTAYLRCVEPVYKEYINPVALRRMSHIIKMGVTAAQLCLKDAEITNPDAIITATGLGCLEDTDSFLSAVIANGEKLLNPTPFIQSTHNTVGAQIALLLKCNNYNVTHVHRGSSFESALIDSMMLTKENEASNVLTGAADEITENLYQITKRMKLWKKEQMNHLQLSESKTSGSIAGEGAAFFLLTKESNPGNYAALNAVDLFYKPETNLQISDRISLFLANNDTRPEDIDLVLYGINGSYKADNIYRFVMETLFPQSMAAYFKHLSGEYHTASSFALWLASVIIKSQEIPEIIRLNNNPIHKLNKVLIYNHYLNINHSLILLSGC